MKKVLKVLPREITSPAVMSGSHGLVVIKPLKMPKYQRMLLTKESILCTSLQTVQQVGLWMLFSQSVWTAVCMKHHSGCMFQKDHQDTTMFKKILLQVLVGPSMRRLHFLVIFKSLLTLQLSEEEHSHWTRGSKYIT